MSRIRSSAIRSALLFIRTVCSNLTMLTARSVKSRIMDSTSRPT